MMVDGRFLKITGRIKELYKLENGKYITPVPLEDSICRSQFILQCMVYGSNRPFNVALIVPDFVQVPPLSLISLPPPDPPAAALRS
jgi:long-chain acyl-CoA synthetase